jgi:GNAT superfamily N-acetyltransferase
LEIRNISHEDLNCISAICLDPSVGKKEKKIMNDAMNRRLNWIREMLGKGLEIFIALEEPRDEIIHYKWVGKLNHKDLAINNKVPMGLLESIPIEYALEPIQGINSLFINCIWILPPFWGQGVGKTLLSSFIKRAEKVGSACVIAYENEHWFDTTIQYMPLRFFKKHQFIEADRDGNRVLLFRDFKNINPPKFLNINAKLKNTNHKLNLSIFCNDQCPWSTFMVKEIQEGVKSVKNVEINIILTNHKKDIEKYGISRGVIMDNKPICNRMVSWTQVKKEIDKLKST